MSKYEPRATKIKEHANHNNMSISWNMRPSGFYATVTDYDGEFSIDSSKTTRSFIVNYYPRAYVTSGGHGKWTYRVGDNPNKVVKSKKVKEETVTISKDEYARLMCERILLMIFQKNITVTQDEWDNVCKEYWKAVYKE